jgi:hypothetical protein
MTDSVPESERAVATALTRIILGLTDHTPAQRAFAEDMFLDGQYSADPLVAFLGQTTEPISIRARAFLVAQSDVPDSGLASAALTTACQLAAWASGYTPPADASRVAVYSALQVALTKEGADLFTIIVAWLSRHWRDIRTVAPCRRLEACFASSALAESWFRVRNGR